MQKVLITGANGFLGYYLSQLLLQKSFVVVATGKGTCRLPFTAEQFSYESMDVTDKESVESAFRKYCPDIVVHCAALSKPDECEQNKQSAFLTNVSGTIHLLEAAAKFKSFFIFLSTDFVFDGSKGMYCEDDDRKAVNYYGQTKILAEDEVKKYPYAWSIVRTVLVYGKPVMSRQNLLTMVANGLSRGEQLKIFGDQVRTPTYVEDLDSAIYRIISKKSVGVFHVSGEDVRTPYQMAVEVAHHLGLDSEAIKEVAENDFAQPARRPLKTGFNIAKAKSVLNFQPISFAEGLKKTFEE